MKLIVAAILITIIVSSVSAQADRQKLVEAERAFARLAAEKGTKTAFLANMAPDAVVFDPEKTPARPLWSARGESASLLEWAPNWADLSADGKLGYTTGNWQYRPKGRSDEPVAFGEFITVWQLQRDGSYKWVIDIGVSHGRPGFYDTNVALPKNSPESRGDLSGLSKAIRKYFSIAAKDGVGTALRKHADDDMRLFREGKMPAIGKLAAANAAVSERRLIKIDPAAKPVITGGLAYILSDYSSVSSDGKTGKGNLLQIWKFHSGKWRLVLEIIKPVTEK